LQEVRSKAERCYGSDRRLPRATACDGGRKDRHSGNREHMVRLVFFIGEGGEQQPESLDLRKMIGRRKQRSEQFCGAGDCVGVDRGGVALCGGQGGDRGAAGSRAG